VPLIAVTSRGNCTFLTKALAAMSRGAYATIIVDYKGESSTITMSADTVVSRPCISISYDAGRALLSAPGCNVSVTTTNDDDDGNGGTSDGNMFPLYTKAIVFAILIVGVVFVLCVYCQSSVRHLIITNRLRAREAEAAALAMADRARAEARLKTLPVVVYIPTSGGTPDNCAICIEEFLEGVELRELPCSHQFHLTCIDPWLLSNQTCPLCKASILEPYEVVVAQHGPRLAAASPHTDTPPPTGVVPELHGVQSALGAGSMSMVPMAALSDTDNGGNATDSSNISGSFGMFPLQDDPSPSRFSLHTPEPLSPSSYASDSSLLHESERCPSDSFV